MGKDSDSNAGFDPLDFPKVLEVILVDSVSPTFIWPCMATQNLCKTSIKVPLPLNLDPKLNGSTPKAF